MKKFLLGLMIGCLATAGASAIAAKTPTPKFGIERVQGVEPNLDIESGIADPAKVGIEFVAPKNEALTLTYTILCWDEKEQWETTKTFEFAAEEFGGGGNISFNRNFYGDADSCTLDVQGVSEGTGLLKVSLLGAGDVPTEPAPEPTSEPTAEPSPTP